MKYALTGITMTEGNSVGLELESNLPGVRRSIAHPWKVRETERKGVALSPSRIPIPWAELFLSATEDKRKKRISFPTPFGW